ncbi:hypothetical protein ACIGXM_31955 [Kitasatospora sp. NPDC052896]|uniref:hypothetical protein n=1 Tax=Kitasatospora sp. NPDC052896 TaxID=3364061 RepID=UPI0037C66B4E
MAVESENVQRLQEWLAVGGPAQSVNAAAEVLAEKLAVVAFDGERGWPERSDRVDAYRDVLRARFADDSGSEYQFVELTSLEADPGILVDWFLPIVLGWEVRDPLEAADSIGSDGTDPGLYNPNCDGTPGTEYYRFDDDTQEYLYAATPDSQEWATYEQRRYAEPARHDDYGLDYRYDRKDGAHQWYDVATATWQDQTWADAFTAQGGAPGAGASVDDPAFAWDDEWGMFYRAAPGGGHEFADALTPGDEASGCSGTWLNRDQALARRAEEAPPEPRGQDRESLKTEMRSVAAAILDDDPSLKKNLTKEDIEEIIATMAAELTDE